MAQDYDLFRTCILKKTHKLLTTVIDYDNFKWLSHCQIVIGSKLNIIDEEGDLPI